MSHSIYSADRTTHLKIVVVALLAGIAIAGLGLLCSLERRRASKTNTTKSAGVIERKAHDGIPNTPSICVGKGISDEARGRPEPRQPQQHRASENVVPVR